MDTTFHFINQIVNIDNRLDLDNINKINQYIGQIISNKENLITQNFEEKFKPVDKASNSHRDSDTYSVLNPDNNFFGFRRLYNIFGDEGSWHDGREKAPAALCRKIAMAEHDGEIEIWGDGLQTRSFLYIDECIEATRKLMESDFPGPINIGSEEMVTINELVDITSKVANKKLSKKHKLDAPLGVRGRNSNNNLVREKLNWDYSMTLEEGITKTYEWIYSQNSKSR